MYIDKELYRQAYKHYEAWNEAQFASRVRRAGTLKPEEAWERYVALVEFSRKVCPEPSQWQRKQKLAALNRYYERVQKLEAWRRKHGKRN